MASHNFSRSSLARESGFWTRRSMIFAALSVITEFLITQDCPSFSLLYTLVLPGTCVSDLTSPFYTCQCRRGYFGETCGQMYCSAHPNPCQYEGTCSSTTSSPFYTCQCQSGYFGGTCGQMHCDAHINTCQNEGTCSSTLTSPFYTCQCKGGYSGQTCGEQYCTNHLNACKNDGECSSLSTSPYYTCQCQNNGYYGDMCAATFCSTHPNPCRNAGTCTSQLTSPFYTCHCRSGYFGETCEERYCTAHPNTCQHGGTCSFRMKSPFYTCQCIGGYFGQTCGDIANECDDGVTYNGTCYFVILHRTYDIPYNQRESICDDAGGTIAGIWNKEHQTLIENYVRAKLQNSDRGGLYIWLSMTYDHSTKALTMPNRKSFPSTTFRWLPGYPRSDTRYAAVKIRVNKDESDPIRGVYNIQPSSPAYGVLCVK